ncbi:hypothetical protein [Paraburkholderia strydomiana]|uniref:hypothetical protein n=1 Tax=Paraburkholderia strydomiana TaxID=1245417 RepID=UPI0028599C78|nr:hypothetical protein [Paraburkholderia strydomiana]MDR7008944.1 hypothetical protein [Paraburkholderia strydomiana]
MNESHLWTAEPRTAYLQWQTTEAAGADRRRFSQRSIVQHKAMFDRFLRHLVTRGVALATFGPSTLSHSLTTSKTVVRQGRPCPCGR